MPKLLVIIARTRPERAGLTIARWVGDVARAHGGFEVEVADLAERARLPALGVGPVAPPR